VCQEGKRETAALMRGKMKIDAFKELQLPTEEVTPLLTIKNPRKHM
jgi:hypothetical protein